MAVKQSEISDFMRRYENASNTQTFENVAELIDPAALFRFNDGDFTGLEAIRNAFEQTWGLGIKDDRYELLDMKVVSTDENSAVVSYNYEWSGTGKSGPFIMRGRGTSVIVKQGGKFQIRYEHLSF